MPSIRVSSNNARPAGQLAGGCAIFFGLPFILAGLAVGLFLYFPVIGIWWSARGWEEVPCWIESAEKKASRGNKGSTTHETQASYRYQYRGRTYRSEEVSLSGGSDNIGDFQQQAYAQLRTYEGADRPFRCYVNPARPEQAVLFRDLRWGLLLLISIFPLIFPLVGGLIATAGLIGTLQAWRRRSLEKLHPGEPWRWRQEWSGQTIQPSKNGLASWVVVTGWIMLVQGPLALAIIVSGEPLRTPLSALALLPGLLVLIPASAVWRRIKTRLTLGRPSLWLKQTPVRPGQTLEGELRLDRVLAPREVIEARLFCQRITPSRSRGKTSFTTAPVWENSTMLSADEARREITGVVLPLRFEIPPGLPCAVIEDTTNANQQHWALELIPRSGGKPAVLPLPVFTTQKEAWTSASAPVPSFEVAAPTTEQMQERLKKARLQVEFDAEGTPALIVCPPGRFRFLGFFLLIFGIVWSAIFVVLVAQGAPWLFRLVWGITSPAIVACGLWALLHHRRVDITREELRITNHIGPLYSWKDTFAPRHIVRFTHDSNMQSGSQFYFRVLAETTFGKKIALIDGITESNTAQALAQRMQEWKKRG